MKELLRQNQHDLPSVDLILLLLYRSDSIFEERNKQVKSLLSRIPYNFNE